MKKKTWRSKNMPKKRRNYTDLFLITNILFR